VFQGVIKDWLEIHWNLNINFQKERAILNEGKQDGFLPFLGHKNNSHF